jgi:hypothetical protein
MMDQAGGGRADDFGYFEGSREKYRGTMWPVS